MVGQTVYEVNIPKLNAGYHTIKWEGIDQNGASVPSGLYLYRISTKNQSVIGKMTLLK
jgi:flagellar hook assembly protein FlgD